jgi:hypothetical protein
LHISVVANSQSLLHLLYSSALTKKLAADALRPFFNNIIRLPSVATSNTYH